MRTTRPPRTRKHRAALRKASEHQREKGHWWRPVATAFLCAIVVIVEPAFFNQAAVLQRTPLPQITQTAAAIAAPLRRRRSLPKPYLKDVSHDSLLSEGVVYRHMITGRGMFSVHVLELDLDVVNHDVVLLKARERFNGLERLKNIVARSDSTNPDSILGAVNANFWSAYGNTAMGPTVSNGEVVNLHSYKSWSSGFFDERNRLYIDRFKLDATLTFADGLEYPVVGVNSRRDSQAIVLYNVFAGGLVPYTPDVDEEVLLRELEANAPADGFDSTEAPIRLEELRSQMMEDRRRESIEYPLPKAVVEYLAPPLINRVVECRVRELAEGSVAMPYAGAIISFGSDFPAGVLPQPGDTLRLEVRTNVHDTVAFTHAVSGVPRLVRDGRARHEAKAEGATSRRFTRGALSRTAIGINRERDRLFLVSVDATNRRRGTRGITLDQLAPLMKKIGCQNAMNLDGGSSSTMIVGSRNVVRMGGEEFNRSISVGLGIARIHDPLAVFWRAAEPGGLKRSFRRSLLPLWLDFHRASLQ